jgi:hypothetical protein
MAEATMVREFRTQRRYAPSGRLERFLRAKYLEQSARPMMLMPAGVATRVFPVASDTGAAPSGRASAMKGTAQTMRTAAKLVALALTLLLFGAIAFEGQAHAGQILAETGVFVGNSGAEYSLTLSTPGSLTVNLIDYGWTSPLTDLAVEITSGTKVLGQLTGTGHETLSVSGPGTYYAYVTGTGTGPLDIGAYGLRLDYQAMAPVPLPASISLLLGGVAALLWHARRKVRTDNDPGLVASSA